MGRFVQLFSQKIDLKIFQSCLWWKKSQVKTISGLDAWLSYIRWYYASNGPALVCCSLVSWVIIFSLIFSSGKIIILLYHLKDLGLFIVCEHQFMIDGMSFHIFGLEIQRQTCAMSSAEEFCLADYDAIGFDLDHTLAKYKLVDLMNVRLFLCLAF